MANPLRRNLGEPFIAPFFDLPNQIREVRKMGVRVLAGISNQEEDIRYFAGMGVDAVMTEDIDLAIQATRFRS